MKEQMMIQRDCRLTVIVFVLGVSSILLFDGCADSTQGRTYPCYRIKTEPVIDGVVTNDPAWKTIPSETGFVTEFIETFGMNYAPSQQTFFKLGYDSENLYLAVDCEEPWVQYLKPGRSEDQAFQKDDGIELFLSPGQADETRHFIVNALGSRWSGVGADDRETDTNDWTAVARLSKASFAIEARIPFGKFGRGPEPGEVWSGNIGRNIITINCPENRKTSWSPVRSNFDEPQSFGNIVFKDRLLTVVEAQEVEEKLRSLSKKMFRLKEEALAAAEAENIHLVEEYEETVGKTKTGLSGVTRGDADLISPPGVPAGEVWRYGLGFPMQISPTEAVLLCNIRMEGSGNIDFEIGSDAVTFDNLGEISAENATPISRYETMIHPQKGKIIVRKGPVIGGFVPLGAKLQDGREHPHAGTGFGMCWAISHQMDEQGQFDYLQYVERYAMMFQFSYDEEGFRVVSRERVDASTLLPEWKLAGNFITNAIPDGPDLLYVMIARVGKVAVAGFTRWQYKSGAWSPVSFTPVTGTEVTWSEPSLIREPDGGLLFSARSGDRAVPPIAFDIGVWRSIDNGKSWEQVIYEENRRARSPVSINRTADGTPYIAANIPPLRRTREILCLWPLDESRTRLECRITARDARAEFGPAPSGSWWRIDHPTSAIIRLADGKWHNVLSYRIVDNGEVEGDAPPAPQTGCYVEEVLSEGKATPVWRFGK
jgi:hypothetical protein